MPAGRPLKFASPEILQEKIDAYFEGLKTPTCFDNNGIPQYEPATITGLALAIGCYRETLLNYEERDEFFDTVKVAKQRCEHYAEKKLLSGAPATGPIFALKNYGWKDSQDVNMGGQSNNPVSIKIDVSYGDKGTDTPQA